MYQFLYLTDRDAALGSDEFVARWRAHYRLATTSSEFSDPIRRYCQNDVLSAGLPGLPQVATGYDALGEFFFDHAEDKIVTPDHIAADGREIFGTRGMNRFGGPLEVHRGEPEGPVRVVRLLAPAAGVGEEQLVGALREAAAVIDAASVAVSLSTEPTFEYQGVLTAWVDDVPLAAELVSGSWTTALDLLVPVSETAASATVVAKEHLLKS